MADQAESLGIEAKSGENESRKIVINLDGERDAKAIKEIADIIWGDELKKIGLFIREALKKIHNSEKEEEPRESWQRKRSHNTITLAGARGSGKTTLILTLGAFLS